MKSAYERAMERFGTEPVRSLNPEQKARIAAIERKYKARIAEVELGAGERLAKVAGKPEDLERVRQQVAQDIAELKAKAEREKDSVRQDAQA